MHSPVAPRRPAAPWQRLLADAIDDPAVLLRALKLPEHLLPAARRAAALFPLRVPAPYLKRIRPGDAADPLLRQVLPLDVECETRPGYSADPLHESAAQPVPGLLKKYHGRALLIATGACAVHCRYCFRRHFPYADAHAGAAGVVRVDLADDEDLVAGDGAGAHRLGTLQAACRIRCRAHRPTGPPAPPREVELIHHDGHRITVEANRQRNLFLEKIASDVARKL